MKYIFLSLLIGCVWGCTQRAAQAGFNIDGSFVTFYGDSFRNQRDMIYEGGMKIDGPKDILIRRALWMIDSLLNHPYGPPPETTYYIVMKFTSDSGSGVFQSYIMDSTQYKAKQLTGKRDEVIIRSDDGWDNNHWTTIQNLR